MKLAGSVEGVNRPRSSKSGSRSSGRSSGRSTAHSSSYPRSARLGETLREVLADELVRIDDERLAFVTITRIDVDPEMNRAVVFYDSLAGEDGDREILEAFSTHRIRLQGSIGRQVRAKKTPILSFRPDEVIRSAERIEKILKDNPSPIRSDQINEDNYDPRKIGHITKVDVDQTVGVSNTGETENPLADAGDDDDGTS